LIGVRDPANGPEAAAEVGCDWVHLDLQDTTTFAPAIAKAGDVEVLVNNAGVLFQGSMLDDTDGFYISMQVMLNAPYELIRLCAPIMEKRGKGRIVNMSSNWGSFTEGLAGPNAYGVAKASLNALTKALVRDLPDTVKINAMCPGWVQTRMGGDGADRTADEGADTAIWLATLPVDGPTGGFFRDRKPMEW